jgi:hypothetical protein
MLVAQRLERMKSSDHAHEATQSEAGFVQMDLALIGDRKDGGALDVLCCKSDCQHWVT